MTKKNSNNRIVYRRSNGEWVNKKNGADKASSVHNTQQEAEKTAKEMLKKQGGGELTIKGTNGQIRSKDTIPPGNDPVPPIDKEH